MPFPNTVNLNPPIGVEGAFASVSATHNVLAPTGQLVADTAGVTIAKFAYANLDTGKVTTAKPASLTNVAVGFVGRGSNVGVIYNNLTAGSGMQIPQGYGVTLFDRGDFFVRCSTPATVGQAIFQNDTTGVISSGTAGGTVAGATEIPLFKVASVGAANSLIKISAF